MTLRLVYHIFIEIRLQVIFVEGTAQVSNMI